MKANKLQTLWIILIIGYLTAKMSLAAIFKSIRGTISRHWVDDTLQGWVKDLFKLLNIQCTVINPHQVAPTPGKATIIMCNHSSHFDIPLSFYAFPNISLRMLAKKEMASIPLMGKAMNATEFPFVDRKNKQQAIKDLEYVKQLLDNGIVMWIAPEGTRSKNGKLSQFKKGGFITAIQTKATIIPIGVRGAFDILPAKTLNFNLNQHAEVHIGQPIDAAAFTLDNKEALIDLVHQEMKKLTSAV